MAPLVLLMFGMFRHAPNAECIHFCNCRPSTSATLPCTLWVFCALLARSAKRLGLAQDHLFTCACAQIGIWFEQVSSKHGLFPQPHVMCRLNCASLDLARLVQLCTASRTLQLGRWCCVTVGSTRAIHGRCQPFSSPRHALWSPPHMSTRPPLHRIIMFPPLWL